MGYKLVNILRNKRWEFFLVFWCVNLLLGVVYKFYYYYTGQHLQYTWLPDMAFLFLLLANLFIIKNRFVLVGVFSLFFFKVIGSLLIADIYTVPLDLYKDVVKTWMGYIYIFPLFLFLSEETGDSKSGVPRKIRNVFVVFAGGMALSVFVGLLFRAYVVHTYTDPERFGISGFLFPSSYVSYFYMISISSAYLLQRHWGEVKAYSILIFALSIAALFSGTKSSYLFLLLFYAILVLDRAWYLKKWFWFVVSGLVVGVFIIRDRLIDVFSVLVELYQKEDFLTFALSYRNVYAQDTWQFVAEHWSMVNYLVGGLNNSTQLTEMGFIDIFLNFGILGFLLFVYLFYNLILRQLYWSSTLIVLSIGILFLVALGGNFFDRVYLMYWLTFLFILQRLPRN